MFPFQFEWTWETARLVFMGGLWYALGIIGLGVTYCIVKAILDLSKGDEAHH